MPDLNKLIDDFCVFFARLIIYLLAIGFAVWLIWMAVTLSIMFGASTVALYFMSALLVGLLGMVFARGIGIMRGRKDREARRETSLKE